MSEMATLYKGKVQVACNLTLPHEDNILRKFIIIFEHIRVRKPYQLPGRAQNPSYW